MSAMRTVAVRNLAAHKVRLALTIASVVLGTAFVAGSFVFTDTLKRSFDTIFQTSDRGIDAQVRPVHEGDPGVPTALVPKIRAVPGVATVEPRVTGTAVLIDSHGTKLQSNGAPSEGGAWSAQSVNPVPTFVSGHAPTRGDEVVVNDGAARKHDLHTGERVTVVVENAPAVHARISGVYNVSYDTGGYIGVLFTPREAMHLFTDGHHYSVVDVAAAPGVSERTITSHIATLLPSDLVVKTGTQVRDADTQGVAGAMAFITYILLGFGVIALLVGTFIIYNTFSMIVAQRQRELALLRAVGASGRQVRRSVLFEAGVVGVVGSALGVAAGLGIATGLYALLDALDLGLPSGGLVMSTRTVVVTVLLGTIVTLFAAYTPARRASRVAPVAAMREQFSAPAAATLRRRVIAGVGVGGLGVAATGAAVASDSAATASALTALGLVGVMVAAMLLSPVFARWIIVPLGRVVGRPFGSVGTLARTNAVRNPRRTAATAFALTLGLVLVAGISVLGSSIKASLSSVVDDTVRSDYLVTTFGGLMVPQPAADAADRVPGAGTAVTLHDLRVSFGGTRHEGAGVDGTLPDAVSVPLLQGRVDTAGNAVMLSKQTASDSGLAVGDSIRFSAPGHPTIIEHVAGIYADNQLLGQFLASGDLYRQVTPKDRWSAMVVLVNAAPGVELSTLQKQLEHATNPYYVVSVETRDGFKGEVAGQVNGMIGIVYGLLALAIVIAVLGIINTLALSVVERRREIGMLRAVGMQRPQVRRTIYLESLLISVFGAVLGLGLGLGFGSLFTRSLSSQGLHRISVPWAQSSLFLALAAVVGVLAALWPGIRAARTKPLDAMATA
jgi:putative ABC transport system permease protein